jgi:hypothetical protein
MTEPFDTFERSLREGPADERGYRFQPLQLALDLNADVVGPASGAARRTGRRPTARTRSIWAGPSLAAVLLTAIVLAGVAVVARNNRSVLDTPGASATPSAIPSPSASSSAHPSGSPGPTPTLTPLPVPALTNTFVSTRNGFSVRYPSGWTVTSATKSWPPDTFLAGGNPALDDLAKHGDAYLDVASQRLGPGQTPEMWLAGDVSPYQGSRPCGVPPATAPRIPVGDASGYLARNECPAGVDEDFSVRQVEFEAIAFSGDRVYVFSFGGNVDLAYFEALLANVAFDPEHALDP